MITHVPEQLPIIFLSHVCYLYTKQYKFRIRIISNVKVQETVKSQMSATTRLTWFDRLSNTANPCSKSISINKM